MGRKEAIAKARQGENLRLMARYNQDEFITGNIHRILEEAAGYFKEATEADGNNAWAWAHWGATLSYRGGTMVRLNTDKYRFYEEAEDKFKTAIQLNPNYAWALAHRGENSTWWAIAERPREDTKKVNDLLGAAKTYLDEAIKIDPNYTWALARRGCVYRFLGHAKGENGTGSGTLEQPNYDEAIKDFSKAIDLNDKYAWAIAFRAVVHRQKARALEAVGLKERAGEQWQLAYLDVEKGLKIYVNAFRRPKVLEIGEMFLPPSGSSTVDSFGESPSDQYAKLALRAYEEGFETLKKEEIDRVLADIAEEWASI